MPAVILNFFFRSCQMLGFGNFLSVLPVIFKQISSVIAHFSIYICVYNFYEHRCSYCSLRYLVHHPFKSSLTPIAHARVTLTVCRTESQYFCLDRKYLQLFMYLFICKFMHDISFTSYVGVTLFIQLVLIVVHDYLVLCKGRITN
jgi:hypothetical protein